MTRSFGRPLLVLALCALTAGCITSAEQQAQRNEERCAARGYQPNTDAFKDCMVRIDTERELRMQTHGKRCWKSRRSRHPTGAIRNHRLLSLLPSFGATSAARCLVVRSVSEGGWCPGEDSNLHASRR